MKAKPRYSAFDERLRDAAPDLLNALTALVRDYIDVDPRSDWQVEQDPSVIKARTAIAKATGAA